MAQAVAEKDAESSLTEGMETMGVQEADKTEKSSQGEKEKQQADKAKAEEASEAMEQGQKQEEEKKEADSVRAEEQKEEEGKGDIDSMEEHRGVQEQQQQHQQEGDEAEWEIPYSDEEMEEKEARCWMPAPQEIKRLYELLAKGEELELNYVPLPRRPPTPPRTPSPERDGQEAQEATEQESENRSLTPTEFDFNEEQTPKNTFINRRRTPGSSARSTVRREARMDKVLSDIKRHRKIDQQLLRSGRDLFKGEKSSPAPKEPPLSPNSQRERDKQRERDSNPNTVFSPRQRRY
ncbi:PAXIP1-associated glutamate-rich protein 1 [Engraulis encrasicolus]|uniref:PAXIP1-associated glutamate-rich protein 1 n=1 Tax=Engraulis encrasicolus TaxID=184585 RepID=UPI002FCF23BB